MALQTIPTDVQFEILAAVPDFRNLGSTSIRVIPTARVFYEVFETRHTEFLQCVAQNLGELFPRSAPSCTRYSKVVSSRQRFYRECTLF